MSDHERFGRAISLLQQLGASLTEARFYADGDLFLKGELEDGREIHLFTMAKEVTNAE